MGDFPTISILGVSIILLPLIYFFMTIKKSFMLYTIMAFGLFLMSMLGYMLTADSSTQGLFEAFSLVFMIAGIGTGIMWFYEWATDSLTNSLGKFGH